RSLQFDLFEATRVAKTWTASVASRLDDSTRLWLFRQLNRLHDADEWLDGDRPVDLDSYKSFVRALIVGYIGGRPAIALGNRGEIIAIWQDNQDRLIVDFYADGKVRFLVNQLADEQRERVAGNTITARLKQVLNPYRHERWFQHGR
ncbi:MAG: hypothetical protein RL145_285, partial [Pseudomonadota bacterium]